VIVDVFNCPFPEAGAFTFEIWFTRSGDAAQKGELPFYVIGPEDNPWGSDPRRSAPGSLATH
jgi:hypothetical protein